MNITKPALELKGEMLMLNVMRLHDVNIDNIELALQQKRDEAPMFFNQSPIVVDCSELGEKGVLLDLRALRRTLVKMDFVPVGLRGINDAMRAPSLAAGWNILRSPVRKPPRDKTVHKEKLAEVEKDDSKSENQELGGDNATDSVNNENKDATAADSQQDSDHHEAQAVEQEAQQQEATELKSSMTVERPIRSGQQVYAEGGDLIVLSPTSAGSEVMADGSIHVYGALRGRVLAGVKGDKTARIFCRSLEAELIVIAGCYQLLDESDTELKGKPAMIHLEDEKLIIEPLA